LATTAALTLAAAAAMTLAGADAQTMPSNHWPRGTREVSSEVRRCCLNR
jgi:hypothetical protein